MKSYHLLPISLLLAVGFVFAGCQMPKSVSVRSEAQYQVPMGDLDLSSVITGSLNSETLISTMQSSLGDSASIYEYRDDSDVLTYLVHYPLADVPFDVGSMLSGLNLDSLLSSSTDGLTMDKTVEIPEMSFTQSKSIAVSSVADSILEDAKSEIADNSSSVSTMFSSIPEGVGEVNLSDSLDTLTINSVYADEIKYSADSKIVLTFTKTDSNAPGSDFSMKVGAVIKYGDSGTEYSSTGETDITGNEAGDTFKLELPLYNGTANLPASFKVAFKGSYSGGTAGIVHSYSVSVEMEDGDIEAIYGIHPEGDADDETDDLSLEEMSFGPVSQTIDSISAYLTSATIAENGGELTIQSALPSGWEGVSASVESLTVSGAGLSLTEADLTAVSGSGYLINQKLDLGGKSIVPDSSTDEGKNISVSGSVKLNIEDGADIDLTDVTDITADVNFEIRKFSEATVNLENLGVSVPEISTTLAAEQAAYIEELSFGQQSESDSSAGYKHDSTSTYSVEDTGKGLGITCKVINSFPEGTNISLKATSEFFNLTGDDALYGTLKGTGTTDKSDLTINAFPTIKMADKTANEDGSYTVDFNVALPETLTVTNIEAGASYEIAISDVSLIADWDYITVNLSSFGYTSDIDLSSLNVSSMLSVLPVDMSNVELDSIPLYLYASKPTSSALSEVVDGLSISGSLKIDELDENGDVATDDEGNAKEIVMLDGGELKFVDGVNWPSSDVTVVDINSEDEDIQNFVESISEEKASLYKDICAIVNDKPSGMIVKPNITLSGANNTSPTVYSYQLESISEDETLDLSIDMALLLPLKINIDGYLNGKDSDGNATEGFDVMSMVSSLMSGDSESGESGDESGSGEEESGDEESESGDASESEETESTVNDLLQRTDPLTYAEYADIADSVQYVKIKYVLNNKLINGLTGTIVIDDTHEGETLENGVTYSGIKKTLTLANGSTQELKLSGGEIKDVLTNYFYPDIILYIGEKDTVTPISISSSSLASGENILGLKITLDMKLDGDTPVKIWADDDSGLIKTSSTGDSDTGSDGSEGGAE